jgi:hypothetical protein
LECGLRIKKKRKELYILQRKQTNKQANKQGTIQKEAETISEIEVAKKKTIPLW